MSDIEVNSVSVPGLSNSGPNECVTIDDWVFVSGQAGVDENGDLVEGGFEVQARAALGKLEAALEATGTSFDGLVRVTYHLDDLRYAEDLRAVRRDVLGDDGPTSFTIGASNFEIPGTLIEVDARAVR